MLLLIVPNLCCVLINRTAIHVDASSVTASNIGVDIVGTTDANTITGSPQGDLMSGGAGQDVIDAGDGSDV